MIAFSAPSGAEFLYCNALTETYTYDANRNLLTVTDWANRVTRYTYDENNRVVGVTKPDGSVTTTVYDESRE
ncbi:MAG: RHS repeat protein [Clostridia bacterium]|nr:RHS repeat protein [Clostridia bacterium]